MKQVWIYGEDDFFIRSDLIGDMDIEEIADNITTTPLLIGYYKPKFNEETQEWIEGATQEEIEEMKRQEEESRPPQEPSEIEILEGRIEGLLESQRALEESQQVQDLLIDDIVFEVIPTLESQINVSDNTAPANVVILTDRLGKVNGGMPTYLAKKIIGGKDYKEVFKINAYKQYQDEVNKILIEQNREDLIIK